MTGTTIAQALPIAISPILTRIYTPEEFGVFAIFIAISNILASLVNGKYELAIGLPEKDEDAINIAALGMLIAIGASISIFIVILLFNQDICILLKNPDFSFWLYWIPISIFLSGFFNILNYLNTRKKHFKTIAIARIYKTTALSACQILLGLIKEGILGLITGHIVSHVIAIIRLFKNINRTFILKYTISFPKILLLAKRYSDFPKYSMPAILCNTLSHETVSLFISAIFNASTLGMYYLVQRVLGAPASLISTAIGQVFLQQATNEKKEFNHARQTFYNTVKYLILIGSPIFLTLFFVSEEFFVLVFGEQWRVAGTYAAILTPLFFVRFVVSTVSMMNIIFEKNHIGFYWQLILVLLSIGALVYSYFYNLVFIEYLYLSTILLSCHYIFLLIIISSYNIIPDNK